ncbi:hypothetical protein ACFC26_17460 [Kitasatospora purpeofusca]|uniref:hypothetical protein n=1 Tax=Kitasatospora purpeofusca TaxID=67352 RepID=UPI0035DF6EBE
MESVLTRDLIRLAMDSIERLGTGEDLPDPVVLNLPEGLPQSHGRTVRWAPLVALAVAGHICQHWHGGNRQRGPFLIENGHAAGGWATLLALGDNGSASRRLQAGGSPWSEHGIRVVELCGHRGCGEHAPAGPGSRCPGHFGDPAPRGERGTHWAEIAAQAWEERYGSNGDEHPRRVADRRSWLVKSAVAAGMTEDELAAAAGLGGGAVDRILRPRSEPERDDYDDAPV